MATLWVLFTFLVVLLIAIIVLSCWAFYSFVFEKNTQSSSAMAILIFGLLIIAFAVASVIDGKMTSSVTKLIFAPKGE